MQSDLSEFVSTIQHDTSVVIADSATAVNRNIKVHLKSNAIQWRTLSGGVGGGGEGQEGKQIRLATYHHLGLCAWKFI